MDRPDEQVEQKAPGDTTNVYEELAVQNQRGAEKPITLTEDHFDKIGPKATDILKGAGVTEISITPGQNGVDKIHAKLDQPFEIEQDPKKADGVSKLIVGKDFTADMSKGKNGEITFDNIKGLKAETNLGIANVVKIQLSRDANGDTEITSVGRKGIFSRTKTRTVPGEVMDKAETIYDRMQELKKNPPSTNNKTGMLNMTPIFAGYA